uniref:Lipocalin/cytosolic fatty-acid binding domain-containing protein n=2 Tax=Amblyomma TaxID=6942 RepID=G3MPC4_AMBMU
MYVFFLSLSLLASAMSTNAEKPPYEEDPDHFGEQYILHMVTINEKLYTRTRNYQTTSNYRCQSAEMIKKVSDTLYKYRLRARKGMNPDDPYVEYEMLAKLYKSGKHQDYNAANFTMPSTGVHTTMKLMTKNVKETCFVFVVEQGDNNKECEILVTKSTAGEEIPAECEKVYKQECPEPYVALYDRTCT